MSSTSALVTGDRVWSSAKTEEVLMGVETYKFRQVKRKTIATGFLPCRKTLSDYAIFSTEFRQVSHGGLGLLEDIDH